MDMLSIDHRDPRLRRPPRRAAAVRLPRRAVLGALRRRRHRARGQDAGRRLRRRRGRACIGACAWLGLARRHRRPRCVFALVHGFASITQRGNQIVSGVAINMLAAGLTALLGNAWFGQGGHTPPLEGAMRFAPVDLPFAEALAARAGPRAALCRRDLRPHHPGLCRARCGAVTCVGARHDALRPAAARGRREPGRGRHGRHLGHRRCAMRRW